MESSTPFNLLNRCVNCAVRFQRNVQRQLLVETSENVRRLACAWISRELNILDAVCRNCLVILEDSARTSDTTRRFGYQSICVPCGSSILRAHQTHSVPDDSAERNIILHWIPTNQVERLQRVCMACWYKASRAVSRQRQQDSNRAVGIQLLEIADSSNVPQPPPMPSPREPTVSRAAVSQINLFNYKRAASTSRHCIFRLCENTSRLLVPTLLKERLLIDHSFYVPRCARICEYHLNEAHNDWNVLYTNSNCLDFTAIQIEDLCSLLKNSATRKYDIEIIIQHNSTLCKYWLGFTYYQFEQLLNEIPAIRGRVKSPKRSLAMFLMKLRTGDSNDRIASLFNVASSTVFNNLNIVRQCFDEQFVQLHLGTNNLSIQQVAQNNLTIPNGLFGNPNMDHESMPAIVICDGTYIYVQKSSNYLYRKQTYSLHKFRNLIKPFLLVCCNGYIVDVAGPYAATESDTSIMIRLFSDNSPMRSFFRENDVFILDRGFRDAIPFLQQRGYIAHMPESKHAGETQLSTLAANKSRCVTLCRWVVEVVNGIFKRDFKLFRQEYFKRPSTHLMLDFKIAAALINRFRPLIRDNFYADQILAIAQAKRNTPNDLASFVEMHNLNRVRVPFSSIDGNLPELNNFPKLSFEDLILFALGIYQIKQARSYYGEHVRASGVYRIEVYRQPVHEFGLNNYRLRGRIQSRHTTRKTYYAYILVDTTPSTINTRAALAGYCCNCLVGRRTVGCCAHVMCIVWFLSWARYQDLIEPPASFLDEVLLLRDDYESDDD